MNRFAFLLGALLCLALPSCDQFDIPALTPPGASSPVNLSISPCDDGESIDSDLLPQSIIDFLDENYPNSGISDADVYQFVGNVLAYGVELDDDLEILFDENGLVIGASNDDDDDDDDDIPLGQLPASISDYIAANYPGATIEEAEFDDYYGSTYIEVELDDLDDLELYFTTDGAFLCLEDDDDDNDDGNDDDDDGDDDDGDDDDGDDDDDGNDDDDDDAVPGPIADFVNANYAGYAIESVDEEDLCNDVSVIEVELEGPDPEPELYFDLDFNFLFAAYEIGVGELPAAVLATIEAEFPNAEFEDDEAERHEYPDGSVQYRVELETADDDDLELVITESGTILCTDD